jgi:hypothetical protein
MSGFRYYREATELRARLMSTTDLIITTMTGPQTHTGNQLFEKRVRSNGKLNDPFLFTN